MSSTITTFGVKAVGLVHVPFAVNTCTSAGPTKLATLGTPPDVYGVHTPLSSSTTDSPASRTPFHRLTVFVPSVT